MDHHALPRRVCMLLVVNVSPHLGKIWKPDFATLHRALAHVTSPYTKHLLRRRHLQAVRQLTTPPPVVTPSPHGPLLAYQRPIMMYTPSWAP